MNLASLSDQELEKIASGNQPVDLSMMSDSDLEKIAGQGQNIVEEMHPQFSFADRAIVKNLAGNNQAAVNYLQQQHPDLEIKINDWDQRILARKRDGSEKDYRVLDPDTGFFSSDFLNDAGDVAFDVLSGLGTGAATAAGGVAGAAAGGLGALPAAAGAGAASSAGFEAARQALGKLAGIDQDINMGDVGFAAATGAISPLLLGTGAGSGAIAKQALKTGKSATDIAKNQRGLVGVGWDAFRGRVAPKLGAAASGTMEDVIRYVRDNPEAINSVGDNALAFTGNVRRETADLLGKKMKEIGKGLESLRILADEAGQLDEVFKVDMTPVKGRFLDELSKLRSQTQELGENPALMEEIATLESVYDSYLGDLPDRLSASNAFELKERLKSIAAPQKLKQGPFGETLKAGAPAADNRLTVAGRDASRIIQDEISRVTELVDPEGSGVKGLNSQYRKAKEIKDILKPFLKDDGKAFSRLNTIRAPGNRVKLEQLQDADNFLGSNIIKASDDLAAHRTFSNAPWLAQSSNGTTSTSRTIGAGALGAGLGYYIGANSGLGQGGAGVGLGIGGAVGAALGGPAALRRYMQIQRGLSAGSEALKNTPMKPQVIVPTWNMMQQRKIEE